MMAGEIVSVNVFHGQKLLIKINFHFHEFHFYSGVPDYVQKTITTVLEIHKNEPPGDILAFLTGQDEVIYLLPIFLGTSICTCIFVTWLISFLILFILLTNPFLPLPLLLLNLSACHL